jgi:hypothetical protein
MAKDDGCHCNIAMAGKPFIVISTNEVLPTNPMSLREWVMESIRWLATTNFLDNLLVTTNSNTILEME